MCECDSKVHVKVLCRLCLLLIGLLLVAGDCGLAFDWLSCSRHVVVPVSAFNRARSGVRATSADRLAREIAATTLKGRSSKRDEEVRE